MDMNRSISSKAVIIIPYVFSALFLLISCTGKQTALPAATLTVQPSITSGLTAQPPTTSLEPSPTAEPSPTVEPSPTPTPRILTICMGAEPDTLFIHAGTMLAASQILQAIYDGPIDTVGFDYQPVILEKLPSSADGDAVIEAVSVEKLDHVVNDAGEVIALTAGEVVRPYGCNRSDCAVEWDGSSALEMAQLSAKFTLLEGIRWSDGEPLNAADSYFGYQVAVECQRSGDCYPFPLPVKSQIDRTATYEALDELTTRWTGIPGYLDPTYRINFFHPLPEHQIGELTPLEMADDPLVIRTPLGWGPYVITKWEPGEYIRMLPNPFYYRSNEGLPRFNQLIYRFVGGDPQTNLSAIESGECDVLDWEASLYFLAEHMDTLLEMDAGGQLDVHFSTSTAWEHVDFSIGHADYDDGYQIGSDRVDIFGDVRIRQAFAQCLDRQEVVDSVFRGKTIVPDTYLPDEHPLYNPQAAHYDFNPEAGSALLEQAGWIDEDGDPLTPRIAHGVENVPDGTPFNITYASSTSIERQQVTTILADSLAQCGIQVNLQYSPAAEFFADAPEGDTLSRRFDIAQFAWLTGVDPPCDLFTSENIPGDPQIVDQAGEARFPKGWKGQNITGYSSPEYDQACLAAKESLPGMPEYVENHMRAQEIFARDLPVIPLYLRIKVAVTRHDFCSLIIDPTSNSEMWNIENFDYGEGCK